MVKMPLLPVADALEGIPPLPRGNGLKGLFIKRVIIKISVKTDCVSLLSHTHTHTHATGEFSPCEKHPRKQECSESQLSPNSVVCHFFFSPNTKQRLHCACEKNQVLGAALGPHAQKTLKCI